MAQTRAATDAAHEAGYGRGDRTKCANIARRMLREPRVVAALKSEIMVEFGGAAPLALATLKDLCKNAPPATRLAAARELLDRAVGPVISKSAVVQASLKIEDLIDQLDAEEAAARRSAIDAEYRDTTGAILSDVKATSRPSAVLPVDRVGASDQAPFDRQSDDSLDDDA